MSFEYNKLRGKIKEVFSTQEDFANAMGMSKVALSQKLNGHSYFTQAEIARACQLLSISSSEDVGAYFFTENVQKS